MPTSGEFREIVWVYYKKHGRHDLPWRPPSLKLQRGKADAYRVLVSEVMLQQTQVERVIPFYNAFIKKYPTAKALAAAPLADVLALWNGLGYNRRAKMLREAAAVLAKKRRALSVAELEALPGVGPYTARAVAAFAYNADVVFVETNIRTAVIHHFFAGQERVADAEILPILEKAVPKGKSREWYSALMDYGAHLKKGGVRANARSSYYAKQAKFEGSVRQVRGAIVRALTAHESVAAIKKKYPDRFDVALAALVKDGMIAKKGRVWAIA